MAYVLLLIGALMAVAGLYLIATGARVVQVEEGWTSVIAGATLFAGGILTIALGLVLRALLDLRGAVLATRQTGFAAPAAASVAPTDGAPLVSGPALSPLRLEPTAEAFHDHEIAEAPLPEPIQSISVEDVVIVAAAEPVPFEAPHTAPAPPAEEPVQAVGPEDLPPSPAPKIFPKIAPKIAPPKVAPNLEPKMPRASDDFALPAPQIPPPPPNPGPPSPAMEAPPTVSAPGSPAMDDDWLDRAFAEFDQDVPKVEVERKPLISRFFGNKAPAKPSEPAPAPEPVPHLEPAYAEAQPSAPPAQDEAAEQPAPQPEPLPADAPPATVIGRYEADGTSYVMYSDGSIEAHSETGVYRFASMAELKAFIES
jgi:hypothetical protein